TCRQPGGAASAIIATLVAIALGAPPCGAATRLALELAVGGLDRPVDLVTAPGDTRVFIVEQPGRVRVLDHGRLRPEPVLGLRGHVSNGNEQGLLSLAFHPRFASNGLLFVNYTDVEGNTNVVRYRVTADRRIADPASATRILFVEQPYANHNGGHLLF